MFESLGRFSYRRRRLVLVLTGIFVAAALAWGTGVFGSLANGTANGSAAFSTAKRTRAPVTL